MINNNIKAVFFDAADTLFYIKDGLGYTYAEPAKKYGIDPDPQELRKAFGKYFPTAPPLAFEAGNKEELQSLEKKWWYDVVHKVYTDLGMFDEFDNYFNDLFETFRTTAWEIFPETKEVLTRLKTRGYMIVVVSNFDSRVYDVCRSMDILDHFDDFVISSESGCAKPSIEIFQLALQRNGLRPDECVHIGDNYMNDYVCPTSIGMNAIFLDRENEHPDKSISKIKDLNELLTIIN
jgi:putative hydrolase of the HAD superfamily